MLVQYREAQDLKRAQIPNSALQVLPIGHRCNRMMEVEGRPSFMIYNPSMELGRPQPSLSYALPLQSCIDSIGSVIPFRDMCTVRSGRRRMEN
jgi:hypothetical protein